MCDLPCSLLFSRILCYYSGLYVCYNIPNMKFTTFAILGIQLSGIKYIHIAVQPSPPSISATFLSHQHQAHFIQGQLPPKSNNACLLDMESQLLVSRGQSSSQAFLSHLLTLLKSLLCYSGPAVNQSHPLRFTCGHLSS